MPGTRRLSLLMLTALVAGCPAPSTGLPTPKATRKPVKVAATASPSALPTLGTGATASPGATPTPDPNGTASPSPSPSATGSPSASPSAEATAAPAAYMLSTLVGAAAGFADGNAADARFDNPNGLDIDAAGNLYVADAGNHRIRKIAPDGATTTLAGSGEPGFANGTAPTARFKNPYGVAVAADGAVYVADTDNHAIRKITAADGVTTLAGSGAAGFADGTGTGAQFSSPFSLALGPGGDLYVADAGNHAIRKVTTAGQVTTVVGGVAGNVNGPFSAAKLNVPNDLAFDGGSKLYVADAISHAIRTVDLSLAVVTTLAGSGSAGFVNDKGVKAKFNAPTGVAVAKNGDVLVADSLNHALRRVTPDGVVTTIAGAAAGFVDGGSETARFDGPTDLAATADGTLYVADTNNNRIRKAKP